MKQKTKDWTAFGENLAWAVLALVVIYSLLTVGINTVA